MPIDLTSAKNLVQSLRSENAKLIINIAQGVFGHIITEIDNYLRMRIHENIGSENPCLFLGEDENLTVELLSLYEGVFEAVSLDHIHKVTGDHVANCHPDLTLDVGMSSYKIAPPSRGYAYAEHIHNTVFYRTGFINGSYRDHIQYYKRLNATAKFQPMRLEVPCPEQLRTFVDRNARPIVLIQQRQEISAANKIIASDKLYEPAIEYLEDSGFTVVFVGREVLPDSWKKLGVIDYANSQFANLQNDFHLFRLASLALLSASGTNWLAEIQATPYLQINNAQGASPPFSRYSITLPSMWTHIEDNKMCTALEQIHHNFTYGAGSVPGMHTQSVDADDILEGIQELENLIKEWRPPSSLQNKWVEIGNDLWQSKSTINGKTLWEGLPKSPWVGGNDELLDGQNEACLLSHSQSRISQKFLSKHQDKLLL